MADDIFPAIRLVFILLGAYAFHRGLQAYRTRRSEPDSADKRRLDRPWHVTFYGAGLFVGGLTLMVLRHYVRWPHFLHDVAGVAIYAGMGLLFIGALWQGWSGYR